MCFVVSDYLTLVVKIALKQNVYFVTVKFPQNRTQTFFGLVEDNSIAKDSPYYKVSGGQCLLPILGIMSCSILYNGCFAVFIL